MLVLSRNTSRRVFLGSTLAWAVSARETRAAQAGTLRFSLSETAGLRRFGYPVHTLIPAGVPGPFRLEREGRLQPAQFTELPAEGGAVRVALDFNASPGPLETETYTLRYGPGTEPARNAGSGIRVEQRGGSFLVRSGNSLTYEVPVDLSRPLTSVVNVKSEFIARDRPGPGLWLRAARDSGQRLAFGSTGSVQAKIVQNGPFAVAIRFKGGTQLPTGQVLASTVECRFPSSKSWIEVDWRVQDPEGLVAALGAGFSLRVQEEPALIDLGANDTVYGTLRGKERMVLESGGGTTTGIDPTMLQPVWSIRKGSGDQPLPFFARAASPVPAQGWAHVMDRSNCTAVALAQFGQPDHDSISVDATGRVELARILPDRAVLQNRAANGQDSTRNLRFWAHFVPTPVQVGALTSPQAMLAPLAIRWNT